jgi:exopolyphosphatase/guanosine-5'-triphosphate,3'-diphosphate pyrophosphatase
VNQSQARRQQDSAVAGHYAVIDVGSNSVRLVVYDALSRAPFPRFNEKSLCGLGAGLDETGALAPEAMESALQAIHRHAAVAKAMAVEQLDIIATEAVRRASNGDALVQGVKERTCQRVRVLSGLEEARYAALGVVSGFYRPTGWVGDLGGGSLEIAVIDRDEVGEQLSSLPIGALPTRTMMLDDPAAAKKTIDSIIDAALPPASSETVFYAVGGGWRALARVHMAKNQAPVKIAHGYEIDAQEARSFAKQIRRMQPAEIAALAGVPSRRVKTLAAAALVLDRVLKRLRPERLVFSALGLREGWLYAKLSPEEQRQDPLVLGALVFGQPRARVAGFGEALAGWTDDLFPEESSADRRLRHAACALADIAWSDHQEVRAKQSFERLLQFPFIGVDHAERVYLAAIVHARYGGKIEDSVLQPAISLISPARHRLAQILGRTLLLGHRLSGSVPEILNHARVRFAPDRVLLEVSDTADMPDSDAVRSRLNYLAKAVGVRRSEIMRVDLGR